MDFRRASVTELAAQVRTGQTSATTLVDHALERIEATNGEINAFVAVDEDRARARAADIDAQVAAGRDPGPLAGVPLAVKDLEDAQGFPTTHGSAALGEVAPASSDSSLVARLVAAGCVVVGKTNTPEFGWKADTENPRFGATRNPWNTEYSPGGSSGGSAAAIAAGMVPLATGSDGGGSLRIPSTCCGLPSIKPSLGRVPSGGAHAPDWHHLSTKGPMAARVADIVAALDTVVGPDPSDLRSLPRPEASWMAALDEPRLPIKVAWSPTLGYAEIDAEVLAICSRVVGVMEGLGSEVVDVPTVFDTDPVDDWLLLSGAYNLRSLAGVVDTDAYELVDPILRMIVDGARSASALDVVRAEDAGHTLNLKLVDLFHDVRLLVTPVTAAAAPLREMGGQGMINGKPDINWVQMTYPFNMTRSPVATVCVGLTSAGIPVGVQLVGPQHADVAVIRAAAALEAALDFDPVAPYPLG